MVSVSAGSYQCVSKRRTVWRIDAKPTATLQVHSVFLQPSRLKKKRGPPPHLSLHSHCILCSALLFTCSYSPFGRRVTFFFRPQLLWQPLFASKKVRLRGQKKKGATTCLGIVLHLASHGRDGHTRELMDSAYSRIVPMNPLQCQQCCFTSSIRSVSLLFYTETDQKLQHTE